MERDEIIIRRAVLHILDSRVGTPVLSNVVLDLSADLNDFLRDHIYKIASGDEIKNCSFDDESVVYQELLDFKEENLVTISRNICNYLYSIMNSNIDIPGADMFVVTYQFQSEIYLALLKMNYKEFYVHITENSEDGNINEIAKQTAALPNGGTKLAEAALIRLSDLQIHLVEKKYDVNGVKTNYFSNMFLRCSTQMSQKAKITVVTKAIEQINKKYYEADVSKQMDAKAAIHRSIIEEGVVKVENIGEQLFGSIPEIKEEFKEKIEKYGIEDAQPQSKQTIKKFEKQLLTTDSGIEISIPMEVYQDKQRFELVINENGTSNLLLKSIDHINVG